MVVHAVYAFVQYLFGFNGVSSFINNSAAFGGAISSLYDAVFSFNGTTNFIRNSAGLYGGAHISPLLCLASMEQPTSSETQQAYMVELSPHYMMLCLTYMESATLSTVNLASNHGGAICSVINNTMTYKGIIHISHNKVERRFKLLNGDG